MTDEPGEVYLDPRELAALRRKAIDECTLCDGDGYNVGNAVGLVCDHVDRSEINRRGMALVREALKGKPNNPALLHRNPLTDNSRFTVMGDLAPKLSGNPTLDPEPEL